jgi:hypothetical protein
MRTVLRLLLMMKRKGHSIEQEKGKRCDVRGRIGEDDDYDYDIERTVKEES